MVRGNRQANKYRNLLNDAINKSDITGIFDSIITIWVEEMASEIHFKPSENHWTIILIKEWLPDEFMQYSIPLHEPIISKLKIESWQMNPNVSDIPQEAKVSIITKTYKEANLYAKIVPTTEWEELVIHIVRKSNNIPNPSLW